ncbi:hypothetical protein COEX109129_41890 [Corallococcus exiguus]
MPRSARGLLLRSCSQPASSRSVSGPRPFKPSSRNSSALNVLSPSRSSASPAGGVQPTYAVGWSVNPSGKEKSPFQSRGCPASSGREEKPSFPDAGPARGKRASGTPWRQSWGSRSSGRREGASCESSHRARSASMGSAPQWRGCGGQKPSCSSPAGFCAPCRVHRLSVSRSHRAGAEDTAGGESSTWDARPDTFTVLPVPSPGCSSSSTACTGSQHSEPPDCTRNTAPGGGACSGATFRVSVRRRGETSLPGSATWVTGMDTVSPSPRVHDTAEVSGASPTPSCSHWKRRVLTRAVTSGSARLTGVPVGARPGISTVSTARSSMTPVPPKWTRRRSPTATPPGAVTVNTP